MPNKWTHANIDIVQLVVTVAVIVKSLTFSLNIIASDKQRDCNKWATVEKQEQQRKRRTMGWILWYRLSWLTSSSHWDFPFTCFPHMRPWLTPSRLKPLAPFGCWQPLLTAHTCIRLRLWLKVKHETRLWPQECASLISGLKPHKNESCEHSSSAIVWRWRDTQPGGRYFWEQFPNTKHTQAALLVNRVTTPKENRKWCDGKRLQRLFLPDRFQGKPLAANWLFQEQKKKSIITIHCSTLCFSLSAVKTGRKPRLPWDSFEGVRCHSVLALAEESGRTRCQRWRHPISISRIAFLFIGSRLPKREVSRIHQAWTFPMSGEITERSETQSDKSLASHGRLMQKSPFGFMAPVLDSLVHVRW